MYTPSYYAQDRLCVISVFTGSGTVRAKSLNATRFETMKFSPLHDAQLSSNFRQNNSTRRSFEKILPETLNQYLKKFLNCHSTQFLKLSVKNIEENMISRDAMFRL